MKHFTKRDIFISMAAIAGFILGQTLLFSKDCQECKEWQAIKPLIGKSVKHAEEDMAAFYVWFHTRELEPVGDEPEDHERYRSNKRWLEIRDAIEAANK